MRLVVVVVLAAFAAPAQACPPLEACVVKLPSTVTGIEVELDLRVRDAIAEAPVADRRAASEPEVPWIWRVLRDQVYSRMPTYEEPRELRLVLAPVVVSSPTDTVPGIGVAGDF